MLSHNRFVSGAPQTGTLMSAGEGSVRKNPWKSTGLAQATIDSPPGSLPISAVFRMRYLHALVRRWAASERITGCAVT